MDFERFVLCAGLLTTLLIGLSVLTYFLSWYETNLSVWLNGPAVRDTR